MNFNGFSNRRIPQLASATQLEGGEYVVVYQDNALKKVTVSQISAGTGTIQGGVPSGGVTGQYLRKSGNGNYETEWGTISFTTDQITEGTGNVYWTNSRFDTRLSSASLNASNLSTGTVSASLLPLATDSIRGSVIVGTNLTVNSGTISLTSGNVTGALGFVPADVASKGAANGIATLGSDSKIPSNQLPAIAITDTFVAASQAAMLALSAQTGDVAVRTDLNKSFILMGSNPTVLSDWQELLTPTDAVQSVNGQTGTVSLSTTNITEGTNLYYTQGRFDTAFGNKSTTNLTEGTNLYYTQGRFDTAFGNKTTDNLTQGSTNKYWSSTLFDSAFSGKSTTNLTEGTNLYWTNTRFDNRLASAGLNASNLASGSVSASLLPLASGAVRGSVIIGSNITNTAGTISLASSNVTGALGFTPLDAAKKGAASGVAELDSGSKVPVTQIPSVALSGLERMFAMGDLSTVAGTNLVCDYAVVWAATTISAIDIVCPITPATGSIVVDIVYRATPGGALTSLYNLNTKPTLSCNGYASWATFTGSNLPDTTSLPQGSIIGFKIISAPSSCQDLYVTVR